jgi:hypothetical protein
LVQADFKEEETMHEMKDDMDIGPKDKHDLGGTIVDDRIFTLSSIIKETKVKKHKVHCCFMDFLKELSTSPYHPLANKLKALGLHSWWSHL